METIHDEAIDMRSARTVASIVAVSSLLTAVACDQSTDRVTAPASSLGADINIAAATVNVANVEDLYAAVNNPANAGAAIILAPGTYALTATDASSVARPNGGRLELQTDMSLYGVTGDRGAVVIDGSAIPASSLNVSFGRTGIVRIGRGSNTIEWLTVLGNPNAAAGIASELPGTSPTQVRVAHVISGGSSRGIDVRNVAANAGRRIDAELIENELFGPVTVIGLSEGIRLVNFNGADSGVIVATLSGNRTYGFQIGCILANNRSSRAVVRVRSSGDRFFANTLGCLIAGGLSQAATGSANSSLTVFESYGSQFVDNTSTLENLEKGGIAVYGGVSTTRSNATSNNTVSISLWGTKVERNHGENFAAFAALKLDGVGIAGTGNQVVINLNGVSKKIHVEATGSLPAEPAGTNTVTVNR